MKEKVGRNQRMIRDYLRLKKEGRSMIWLVAKYKISSSRIYLILRREGVIVDNH